MTDSKYCLWTLYAGVSEFQCEETILSALTKVTPKGKQQWMELISKQPLGKQNDLSSFKRLIGSFNRAYPNIEEKTPLALFVANPQLFFEIFWPYARARLGREYYILRFENPLMVSLNSVYELHLSRSYQPEQQMIYLGCLSHRVPILMATVNDIRESIIPYEVLVPNIRSVLEKSADWLLLKDKLNLANIILEYLVRETLTISKPQFLEFNSKKYVGDQLVIVSLTAKGSLLKGRCSESGNRNRGIATKIRRAFSFPFRFLIHLVRSILGLSLREPRVHLEIYPKSPSASHWTYIYAPEKYHLEQCSVSRRCKDNTLEYNSPDSPTLLSYRLGREKTDQMVSPIDLDFNVRIPMMDHIWLNAIDKLLLVFSLIWLMACLKLLLPSNPLSAITQLAFLVATHSGILDSTFVLIGFVLLARSWLFHESTVFKSTSIRFAIILVFLTMVCLAFVFISSISSLPSSA